MGHCAKWVICFYRYLKCYNTTVAMLFRYWEPASSQNLMLWSPLHHSSMINPPPFWTNIFLVVSGQRILVRFSLDSARIQVTCFITGLWCKRNDKKLTLKRYSIVYTWLSGWRIELFWTRGPWFDSQTGRKLICFFATFSLVSDPNV